MIKRLLYRPEFFLGLFLILICYCFIWSKEAWRKEALSSDGRGYYAYLPALFIYQDLTYETSKDAYNKKLELEFSYHTILKDKEGNTFNKCFPGVALVQLPLFLLATLLSFIFGLPVDGYNDLYLISITLTGILSAVIGFHFLKKLLIALDINRWTSIFTALAIYFGTNVFFYSMWGASIGHIHSYAATAAFLFYAKTWFTTKSVRAVSIACFLLGLIFILRPTNVVVIFMLPFLAGTWQIFKHSILNVFKNRSWIWPLILGILPVLLLPTLWYAQTGHLVVWSYSDEGFYFGNPRMISALFSFRNGLFIWSPLAFISLIGIYFIYKKSTFQASMLALFFLINLYIISSWWCFAYGGGFGHRAFVDHQVFFGILMAYGITHFPYRNIYKSAIILTLTLSVIQTYQYTKGILPAGYCTAEIYGHIFLKLDKSYIGECRPRNDEYFYGETVLVNQLKPNANLYDVRPDVEFCGDASYNIVNTPKDHRIYLEFDYTKKRLEPSTFNDVYLIIDGKDETGKTTYYSSCPLYEIRSEALNEWKTIHLGTQLPRENIANYKMYIWNNGHKHFKVKDITYTMRHISAKDF